MTTYAPYPEVPTAAVLPVDDCVIAPPVTATSTVFRTPNCPTIRWEASRCREPSALAFAVRRTSNMDTRMVSRVDRTQFLPIATGCTADKQVRRIAGGEACVDGVARAAQRRGIQHGRAASCLACCPDRQIERTGRCRLVSTQGPRICSVISNPRRAKWLPKLSIKVIP